MAKKILLIIYISLVYCSAKGQYTVDNEALRSKHLVQMYSLLFQKNFELSKRVAIQYCRDSTGILDYPFMHGLVVSCSNLGQVDTCFMLMRQLISTGNYSILDRLQLDYQLGPLLINVDSIVAWQNEIDSIYFNQQSKNNPDFNLPLAKEILNIYTADQWPRYYHDYYNSDTSNHYDRDSAMVAWQKVDSINQVLTGRIFEEYGWPTPEMVGFDLSQAIWYPLQHGSVSFQKKYVSLARRTYQKGNLLPSQYAGLVDRLAVNQGKKQLYGTQFEVDENGNYIQSPIKRRCFLKRRLRKMNMENIGVISQ